MASKVTGAAKGGIRAWLMPEIHEIKLALETIRGEMKVLDTKIGSLDAKIDSVRNELKADIARVDSKVEDLDKRLDVAQRLAVLEARVKERG